MSRYISDEIRKTVKDRAKDCCEYCLIHQNDSYFTFQIDHIISLKHGGKNDLTNLAYTCIFCNRNKGSDIGSVLKDEQIFIRFFNPRTDTWTDHFSLNNANLVALTDIGKVTSKILKFNEEERILERRALIEIKHYPPIH